MNSDKTTIMIRILFCMCLMTGLPNAQTVDPTLGPRGFVRLMNAVGVGSGKLDFLIDGKRVRSEGYEPGDVTGGIPRMPAAYRMQFRRSGIEPGETTVNVIRDETITLIPFAEYVPANDEKAAHWTIRILRLKQSERRDRSTATIVNLTRKPELKVQLQRPDEEWVNLSVKRLALERVAIRQRSGYVPLRTGLVDLQPLSVGSSGNFVAVIYENEDGAVRSMNFQDIKYLSVE